MQISHVSNFWFGEETGTVAFALVLRSDAQNVRKRMAVSRSDGWEAVVPCLPEGAMPI
jgi:hypothetical protein